MHTVYGLYYLSGQITLRYHDEKYETYTLDGRFLRQLADVLIPSEWLCLRLAFLSPGTWIDVPDSSTET